MLSPTFLNTCTTITESIAVAGVAQPVRARRCRAASSMPLMPPLSCSRKPQTMVQATSETTTGEKNRVRNTAMPRSFWLSSTASSSARLRLSTTSPAENSAGGAAAPPGRLRVAQQLLVVAGADEVEGVGQHVPLVQRVPDHQHQRHQHEDERAGQLRRDEQVARQRCRAARWSRTAAARCGSVPIGCGLARRPSAAGLTAPAAAGSGRRSLRARPGRRRPAATAASRPARTVCCSSREVRCGRASPCRSAMPSTTTFSSCAGESSGLVLPSTSAFSSDLRAGGKNCASLAEFSGLVKKARKSAAACGVLALLRARRCRPGRPPRTRRPGPAAAAPGPSRSACPWAAARRGEIWVIVIAASPAKKSAFCARAGHRLVR